MMDPVPRLDARHACPVEGRVVWDAGKIAWFGGHAVVAASGLWWLSPGALLVFAASTWVLVMLGHSLGYHRLLMHGNFAAPRWLGRALIACGALIGSTGPSAIVRVHDERDWAQRAPDCHPFYSQDEGFWRDMAWQMLARVELARPPRFQPDPVWGADPFVRHLDRWWRVWALAPAVPLFLLGGWGWVAWGVSARILATNIGHWAVNHVCHHRERDCRHWDVPANGVQANDLARTGPVLGVVAGLLTAGECWHATHHAFPESANTAIAPGQFDPGWWLLRGLKRLGLVWDIREARAERGDLLPRPPPAPPLPPAPHAT